MKVHHVDGKDVINSEDIVMPEPEEKASKLAQVWGAIKKDKMLHVVAGNAVVGAVGGVAAVSLGGAAALFGFVAGQLTNGVCTAAGVVYLKDEIEKEILDLAEEENKIRRLQPGEKWVKLNPGDRVSRHKKDL